jgi:hypothetical protein
MRFKEIRESASTVSTGSGSIAPVSQPLLTQSRSGGSLLSGKYTVDQTPNTPQEIKRYKQHAVGRFKNSPGH